MSETERKLAGLCRELGDPAHEWAILAEGNASAEQNGGLLVTASGCTLGDPRFVSIDRDSVLAAIECALDDEDWTRLVTKASSADDRSGRATIEVGLHAVATAVPGVSFVGHTHPTSVTGLLCSGRAEELVTSIVFPDQVVVCGADPLFIPYVDPGLSLARAVGEKLERHCDIHGGPPKTVYLQNHGLIALGSSPQEVVQITAMADKAARVITAALASGGVVPLPRVEITRIDGRADEAYRRAQLRRAELS